MRLALRALSLLLALSAALGAQGPSPARPIDWTAMQTEAVEVLRQYLRINTSNPPGNELETARFLKALLEKEGIEATILDTAELGAGRANLYAMNFNNVTEMWVYKVAATTDKPIGLSDFSTCTTCVKFRWDTGTLAFAPISDTWPSVSQNACSSSSVGGPPDRIGVYLKLRHDAFTGFVFNTLNISEASILSLEPMPVYGGCKP